MPNRQLWYTTCPLMTSCPLLHSRLQTSQKPINRLVLPSLPSHLSSSPSTIHRKSSFSATEHLAAPIISSSSNNFQYHLPLRVPFLYNFSHYYVTTQSGDSVQQTSKRARLTYHQLTSAFEPT
ncbi:hypothetical protein BDZ91DRAFT_709310 [Kalaharituber pfeilii]|nr:hypothetical protein BDZ91DRAFT_709310 [Kalaharituber pfeilii]